MLKNLFKASAIYTVANIFSRGIGFFLLPIVTLYLTPEDYGVLDLYTVFSTLVGVVLGLELTQGIARYSNESTFLEKVSLLSTTVWFIVIVYAFAICGFLVFSEQVNFLLIGSTEHVEIFSLVAIIMVLTKLGNVLQAQLKWDLKPKYYTAVSILYTTVFATSVYTTLVVYNLGLKGYFISQLIASTSTLLVSAVLNRKYLKFIMSIDSFKRLFKFSLPLVFSSLTIILSTYIDRIAIRHFLSLDDLGIYGIAFRFATLSSILLVGVQSALLPLIYKEYKRSETKAKLKDAYYLFYTIMLTSICFFSFFSKELLIVLTSEVFYTAAVLIPILSTAVFFNGMYIFAVGIAIEKKTKVYVYVGVFSLIANVILNIIMIPLMGLLGAALATLFTSLGSYTIYIFNSQKYYQVSYNFKRLVAGLFGSAIVCVLVNLILSQPSSLESINVLQVVFKFVILTMVSIGTLILLFGFNNLLAHYKNLKQYVVKQNI